MQHRRFDWNDRPVLPMPATMEGHGVGFVACPAALWTGMTWQQMLWRQWVYRQAWAQAQAASPGVREFKARAAAVPRAWRN